MRISLLGLVGKQRTYYINYLHVIWKLPVRWHQMRAPECCADVTEWSRMEGEDHLLFCRERGQSCSWWTGCVLRLARSM